MELERRKIQRFKESTKIHGWLKSPLKRPNYLTLLLCGMRRLPFQVPGRLRGRLPSPVCVIRRPSPPWHFLQNFKIYSRVGQNLSKRRFLFICIFFPWSMNVLDVMESFIGVREQAPTREKTHKCEGCERSFDRLKQLK